MATRTAPRPGAPTRVGPIFAGLMLAMVLASLDQTIVSTALPTIVGELGGFSELSWVVTAYLLTSTVSTPIYGKLGDLYGRKKIFLFAIVVFLIGSALCGLSQNMGQLIAFRALQGIGGGGLIVGAQAIIADVVSPRERGRYSGYFGAVFGFTSIAGPLIGGFIVDHTSWRWVFYINLPLGILALAVIATVLRSPTSRVAHRIDYLGTALLSAAVVCVVLLTTWGGTQYGWTSPTILGLGVGALVAVALFIVVEQRAAEPVIPLSLFRGRVFTVSSLLGLIVGFSMFGAITYLPQYQQIVRGASPTSSGLQLLPLMAGVLAMSIGSGQLITRTGRYKVFPIVGTAVITLAMFLLSRLGPDTPDPLVWLYALVLGTGLGLVMQVLVLAVQNAVPPEQLGTATSGATFFRSIGGSIGVSVFSSIFNARFAGNLAALPAGQTLSSGTATLTPTLVAQLPAEVHAGVITAFSDALSVVFLAAIPVAALAFALSWALPEVPLRTRSAPMDAVAESFGMVRTGAAQVLEETQARTHAAQTALDRLDDIATRNGLAPDDVQPLRGLFTARIASLNTHTRFAADTIAHHADTRHTDDPAPASSRAWQLALAALQADRRTQLDATLDPPPADTHDLRARMRREAGLRLRGAHAALARLDELAADSGVPDEQIAALRAIFTTRLAHIESTIDQAKARADQGAYPVAFWQVAAELLTTERQALAQLTTLSPTISRRADDDLAAEQAQLSGT